MDNIICWKLPLLIFSNSSMTILAQYHTFHHEEKSQGNIVIRVSIKISMLVCIYIYQRGNAYKKLHMTKGPSGLYV